MLSEVSSAITVVLPEALAGRDLEPALSVPTATRTTADEES